MRVITTKMFPPRLHRILQYSRKRLPGGGGKGEDGGGRGEEGGGKGEDGRGGWRGRGEEGGGKGEDGGGGEKGEGGRMIIGIERELSIFLAAFLCCLRG